MTTLESLYDELIGLSYECVLDESVWPHLLERLMAATGHQQSTLLFWDRRDSAGQVSGINLLDPATVEPYNSHYCQLDPTHAFMAERPVGVWYHDVRELGLERMRTHPFYQEMFRPFGLRTISCLKLHEQDQAGSYLSLLTQLDAREPSAEQHNLLRRLTPHLLRAGRMASYISCLEMQRHQRDLFLDHHQGALWLIDPDGRLQYCNRAAEQAIAQASFPLELRGGRLHGRLQDKTLQGSIKAAGGRLGSRRAGIIRLAPGGEQLLLITPVAAEAQFNLRFQRPMILVLLLDRRPNTRLLGELFQLSPAELRLAELITLGKSPESCADLLGVSINTVRTQLRALFRKTDTERQSELVSLFARLCQG